MRVYRGLVVTGAIIQIIFAILAGIGAAMRENAGSPGMGSFILALSSIVSLMGARSDPGRRSGTKRAALWLNAFLFVLAAIVCVVGFSTLERDSTLELVVAGLMAVMAGSSLCICIGLAGLGRMPIEGKKRGVGARILLFTGGGLAAASLGLGIAVVLYGALSQALAERGVATPRLSAGAPPKEHRFEDLNFVLHSPRGWVDVNPANINADAALMLSRGMPESMFMVIVERPGPGLVNTDGLVELSRANLRSRGENVQSGEAYSYAAGGLIGKRFASTASLGGRAFSYEHWVCEHNGYAFQLITLGRKAEALQTRSAADQMLSSFLVIDPERTATSPMVPAEAFTSAFGYQANFGAEGWGEWDEMTENMPYAETGAALGMGFVVVVPVSLEGTDADMQTIASALLGLAGLEYPGEAITSTEEIARDGLTGLAVRASKTPEQTAIDYRARVLRGERAAYMLLSWVARPEPVDVMERALDAVRIDASAAVPTFAEMNDRQKLTQADFVNHLGLALYNRGDKQKAVPLFRRAMELKPEVPVFAQNAAETLFELGEGSQALELLRARTARHAPTTELLELEAQVSEQLGDSEGAIAAFERLLQVGGQSDDRLSRLIVLLAQAGRVDRAEQLLKEHAEPGTGRYRLLRAELLRNSGDVEGAITVLREGVAGEAFERGAAESLFDLYYELDRFNEGLEIAERLIAAGDDTALGHYRKALSETALGWYPRAKSSIERAMKHAPNDQDLRAMMNHVVSRMGQGDTTGIKPDLERVQVPPELLQPEPGVEASDATGAAYEYRVIAVEYAPGKRPRRTEYSRARVLDRRGVDGLGSIRFWFDPTYESLCVNSARVLGEDGAPVWEGSLSDYFVMDDAQRELASNDKVLHIPVAALSPGRILEVVVTREENSPRDRMPYTEVVLGSVFPVERWSVLLRGDASVAFSASESVVGRELEGDRLFEVRETKPRTYEALQGADLEHYPWVRFAPASSTWAEEGASYLKIIEDRLEIDEKLRELAQQLTSGLQTPREKIEAIASHVQNDYRYLGVLFGPRAYIPNPGRQIVVNRYGDCKDHSLLAHLLLRAAGVESYLALVRTDVDADETLVSRDQFDHMIVHVPALGEHAFIDLTDKNTDALLPAPFGLGGRRALVLDPAGPRLVAIPDYPAGSSRMEIQRTVRVEDEHDALVEEQISITGYMAAYLRSRLSALDQSEYLAAMQLDLSGQQRPQMLEVSAENVFTPSLPIRMRMKYRVNGVFHAGQGVLSGRVPALYERLYLAHDPSVGRRSSFVIRYPLEVETELTLELPEGYRPVGSPGGSANSGEFGSCEATAREADGKLSLSVHLERSAGRYPPEKYEAFWKHSEDAIRLFEPRIVLERH